MDQRWIDYCFEFHVTRDYYACHDYLEDWWFELGNPQNHPLMAFIQLAVALYHYRADNLNGARILLEKALPIFEANINNLLEYGIDVPYLFETIEDLQTDVRHQRPFKDINFKFRDEKLETILINRAQEKGLILYQKSDMNNLHLIHKHKFKHR